MRHPSLALVIVLASCVSKQEPPPPPVERTAEPEATPPPPPKPAPKPAVTDLGSCTLKVSGAVTAEQTTPGGREAVNISYWYTGPSAAT